ncbi:MAG: Chromate resistance protein ChrB, partial [Thermaurantiacus sp.]
MTSQSWLLLTYKVPPEPASKRVAIWRRLKGMGAVYLQNGVCLLPKTDDHVRRLKMLENDVAEVAGESVLLETVALDRGQQEKVVGRFKADRDEAYREFIDK